MKDITTENGSLSFPDEEMARIQGNLNSIDKQKDLEAAQNEIMKYTLEDDQEINTEKGPVAAFKEDLEQKSPQAHNIIQYAARENKTTSEKVLGAILSIPSKIYEGLKSAVKNFVKAVKSCFNKFMSLFKKKNTSNRLDNSDLKEKESLDVVIARPIGRGWARRARRNEGQEVPPKYEEVPKPTAPTAPKEDMSYADRIPPGEPPKNQGQSVEKPPSYKEVMQQETRDKTARARSNSESGKKWTEKASEKKKLSSNRGRSNTI